MADTPKTADDVKQAIADNATGPRRVAVGDESAEAQPIQDQIAAHKHLTGDAGVRQPHRGLRFTKLISPGPG